MTAMRVQWDGPRSTDGRWLVQTEQVRGEGRFSYLLERGRGTTGWGELPPASAAVARRFTCRHKEGTMRYAKALAQAIVDAEADR